MLILLFVIFTIIAIGFYVWAIKSHWNQREGKYTAAIAFTVVAAAVAFVVLGVGVNYKNTETVDARIELYTTENEKIEITMATIASEYKEFEKETYESLLESPEIILTIPELKSDTIVQEQIKIYKENKAKIIALQEEKLNRDILRWWLFF